MQAIDGELILSATDVVGFGACGHRTALDREVALGIRAKPQVDNPMGALLGGQGDAHQEAMLDRYRAAGLSIVKIPVPGHGPDALPAAEAQTVEAMRAGADVIYQATFFDLPWRGHADFLLKVDTPSDLGAWSYEVGDAKLHKRERPSDWLQIAYCSKQVARLQGRMPVNGHVLLGGGDRATGPIAKYLEKVKTLQDNMAAALAAATDAPPEPNDTCSYCRWEPDCRRGWLEQGHLSVLGIDRRARKKLVACGVATIEALAETEVDGVETVDADTVRRLRSDARLWLHEQHTGVPHVRLRYPRDNQGLSLLPTPVDGDVFFDLEGSGFGPNPHREYLWGAVQRDEYRSWWAHTAEQEEEAFGAAVMFFETAIAEDPDRRIYHYASYEVTAMRRLAARVGGELSERALQLVDTVFVDVYGIARWSVRTSSMSAGLKTLERFYRPGRSGGVTSGGGSMVSYEAWVADGNQSRLDAIEAYNRDDCESLADLRDWLIALAAEVADARRPADDPAVANAAAITDLRERLAAAASMEEGGPLLRRTLVALAFDNDLAAASVLGWTGEQVAAALLLGKKELGLPIPVTDLARELPA
jgi:predicted RecB family nuclease